MKKIILLLALIWLIQGIIIFEDTIPEGGLAWNISTSKYMANYSNVLDVNETVLNETIESHLTSITYNATAISTIEGSLDSGALIDILTIDDRSYNVSEDAGASPLIVEVTFTGILSFNTLNIREWYDGGLGHEIDIQIWNKNTMSWDNHGEITDQSNFVTSSISILDPTAHIDSGVVLVRFDHTGVGNSGHDFFLDYIRLVKGFSTLTTSEHDAQSERENYETNHPVYRDAINERLNKSGGVMSGDLTINSQLNINNGATPLNIINDYEGIALVTITNPSGNQSLVTGSLLKLVDDKDNWCGFGKTNSNTTLAGGLYNETGHLYCQGYAPFLFTNDGNKPIWFNFNTADAHNFVFETKVIIDPDGNITTDNSFIGEGFYSNNDINASNRICDGSGNCLDSVSGETAEDVYFNISRLQDNVTFLLYNASNQDDRIIAIEDDYLTSADIFDDTFLLDNATNQDDRIIFLETNATQQEAQLTALRVNDTLQSNEIFILNANASNQDDRIIVLEDAGSGGENTFSDVAWIDSGNSILSNSSINSGTVNISGNTSFLTGATKSIEIMMETTLGQPTPSILVNNGQGRFYFISNQTGNYNTRWVYEFLPTYANMIMYTNDNKAFQITKYNGTGTLASYDGHGLISNNGGGLMIQTIDFNDYFLFRTESNIPEIGCEGCTDIYFQDSASGWETLHADEFTPHTDNISKVYVDDIGQLKTDLEQVSKGESPINLAPKSTRNKILNQEPITEEIYEDTGIGLGALGQANAKLLTYVIDELCQKDNSYNFCVDKKPKKEKPIRNLEIDNCIQNINKEWDDKLKCIEKVE